MLAEVRVLEQEIKQVIVLSQDIIQQELDGRRYVFVAKLQEDGHLHASKVYVTTGQTLDNRAVVDIGLKAGDVVVTTGSRGLVDGQLITLSSAPLSTADNGK
ncbi:MAG: hypothetical protein HC821_04955 [Lewinella sp.]|nr:hypothetical protein [Lewinella sp.]